jgi:single-stranded-DNA-specific exonuclease
MEKIWKIKVPNIELQKEISQDLDISEPLAQMLINRGVKSVQEAHKFLDCNLSNLHNPFLLQGMKKAIHRIKKAIAREEKIMVWGDYDIDGISAVCLLICVLKKMGAQVCYYLPNRLEEGYGLNKKGIRQAKKKGVQLLITVDCGISALEEIDYLNKLGIDTIITDHHQPKVGKLPQAWAIINPLQKGCLYPYKYLSGVGLAFKLACALTDDQNSILEDHLDIIALGTIGDIVPITGENRILAKHGLGRFAQTKKPGLKALMDISGLSNREINARHIGYILGPRINASGRLGSPEDSLRLLFAQTQERAYHLAQKLDRGNRTRQKMESQTFQEAIELVERQINFKEHSIIVLGAAHWHQGVVGIVASRLVERYLRPTIVVTLADDFGHGSGRSIGNFHLLEAVTRCKDLLEEYGGHRQACGIRIKQDRFQEFFRAINQVTKEMLMPEDLVPTLEIDFQLPLYNLDFDFINQLDMLSPFGTDNPPPLICSSGLKVRTKASLIGGNHVKFWVTDGRLTCEAIGYNKASSFPLVKAGQTVALAYSPSINCWQGNFSIQLKIEDLKVIS